VDVAQVKKIVEKFFGEIPSQPQPARDDLSEPRQETEKRSSKEDAKAPRPALAVAWHVPPRWTPEWFAFGLLDYILVQGRDSRLYESLVRGKAYTGNVGGGINPGLGNQWNYHGPMLYTINLFHDAKTSPDTILAAMDAEIEKLRTDLVDQATLDRARTRWRSGFYNYIEALNGFGKADILASLALFDDNPGRINEIEKGMDAVTPELLRKTAQEWLRKGNRSILTIVPAPKPASTGGF
jgi:predicted Zn-dependent peptidase